MRKFTIKNFWLKVIALFLAIVTWFYISGELTKMQTGFYPRPPTIAKP